MNIDKVIEGAKMIQEGLEKLNHGPLPYTLRKLSAVYQLVLDKYLPFRVGDIVVLSKTPQITVDHGWYFCRHFIIEGAKGVVREVDCNYDAKFMYMIEFFEESWIDKFDPDEKKNPVTRKHTFAFSEDYLIKIS